MNARLGLGVLLFAACEGGHPPSPIVVEDVGRVCLHGDPLVSGAQTFAAGSPVNLVYEGVGECLSSSCTTDRSAACSATLEGGVVQVRAVGQWVDISAQQQACTADCQVLGARCATVPLPAGVYEVRFGPGRVSLAVPSQHGDPPCIAAQ